MHAGGTMEVEAPTTPRESSKYLRVFPILSLLFYYIGALITSLEVADIVPFLIQIVLFSAFLLIGLVFMRKEAVILGALLLMLGSLGPIVAYLLSMGSTPIGPGVAGGAVMAFAFIFHIMTIVVWIRK